MAEGTFTERPRPDTSFERKVDNLVGIFSPKAKFDRLRFRMGYDALSRHRTQKKRPGTGGTGDTYLTGTNLYELREIHRDLMRNNPIVKGLLKSERDEVIGSGPKVQARSADTKFNEKAELLWKNEMLNKKCDVTGRFNFNQLLRILYLSYRRDGDAAVILLDDRLQAVEGEQIGTPYASKSKPEFYDIINGVAFAKEDNELLGYYIGKAEKYGYIKNDSYKMYEAARVHHLFNPERISQSRGEPALTSSIDYIDKLSKYIDAEVVAAAVNACFTVFISQQNPSIPNAYTRGISSSGYDEKGNRLEKLEPGTIMYGDIGEKAVGIGNERPAALFDPFVMRMLSMIARPLGIPLMLILLDYSGATFMNARIAYQQAQKTWVTEQSDVVVPFVSRVWLWFIARMLAEKKLSAPDDAFVHEVICNRWPYVDPYKEAIANKVELENRTTTRKKICARNGDEFDDIVADIKKEEEILSGLSGGKVDKGTQK